MFDSFSVYYTSLIDQKTTNVFYLAEKILNQKLRNKEPHRPDKFHCNLSDTCNYLKRAFVCVD